MNMKKTIAAVAACAMAVSAMATTVSAVDENATEAKSVHYDLTIKSKAKSADLTFVGKGITDAATKYELFVPMSIVKGLSNDVTVTVADKSTKTSYTFTFSANKSSANYDGTATLEAKDLFTAAGALGNDWTNDTYVYTIDLTTGTGAALQAAFDGAGDGVDFTLVMKDVPVAVDQAALNDALVAGAAVTSDANLVAGAIALTDGTNTYNAKGAVKESEVKQPMKTTANTTTGTAEIFARLATAGTRNVDGGYYVNASAVINDMVANYDDVVFTFNTATDNVLTASYLSDKKDWIGNAANFEGYYVTGVPAAESWMGDSTFKSFPQHLYNLFGDESTGYTYSDSYVFNNLFNAALVANNGYTMNQSTVTPFEYSKTSVSFSWSDLTGGNSFVSPASAVNKLQLATSSEWYWDSMDVAAYVLSADDASTDAGIEDEGEDLEDEADGEDDVIDEGDDTDVVDDTDVDVDDVDVDVDDVDVVDDAPVSNPSTGNAPIALAVIPVALAAAAVVAKKRG